MTHYFHQKILIYLVADVDQPYFESHQYFNDFVNYQAANLSLEANQLSDDATKLLACRMS